VCWPDRLASAPECHGRPVVAGSPRTGSWAWILGPGVPDRGRGRTSGANRPDRGHCEYHWHGDGGVMSIVSGLILEASGPGDLSPVLVVYGLFGLFGVAVAAWIQFRSVPT